MTARFDTSETRLPGLAILQRKPVGDARGYFERLYCSEELAPFFARNTIAQINRTLTFARGTVRGMHFQHPPHAELKLVTCVRGEVFDVAVDLRKDSPTFLKWHGEILSQANHRSLLIPEGFAHGFQTLSAECEMIYLHTTTYHPEAEGGLNALDPILAIEWPESVKDRSDRDKISPMITRGFRGIEL